MISSEQNKDIIERLNALKRYLNIDAKKIEIANEEEKTFDPNFWNNPKEAEIVMKQLRVQKKWVSDYNKASNLIDELQVLIEFYNEGEIDETEVTALYTKASTQIEDLEFKNMLSEEGDSLSAVLQITAGAGGTESCDWAEMLLRMYLMYCEDQGFKTKELNYQAGDVAGVKTVTIEIEITGIGLDELSDGQQAYPNPVEDVLYLDFDNQTERTIQVYNGLGLKVAEFVSEGNVTYDASKLASGVYYISVLENGTWSQTNFVKH